MTNDAKLIVKIPAMLAAIANAGLGRDDEDPDLAGEMHQAALDAAVEVFIQQMDNDLYEALEERCGRRDVETVIGMMAADDGDKDDFGLEDVEFIYE